MSIEEIDPSETLSGERVDLVCPRCGSPLVLRHSNKNQRSFYGCVKFPACKGSLSAYSNGAPKFSLDTYHDLDCDLARDDYDFLDF